MNIFKLDAQSEALQEVVGEAIHEFLSTREKLGRRIALKAE